MASYVGIGADDPNHPLEVEGQVFISNVEQGSATNLVPFEVYSDYTGITGDILEGARQMRLRVTPSGTTTSNVNMDMGIEPTSGSYFYISNPVENATLGSNTAFRIVQAGHVEIGSNLSVSGNVVASNIIGGSPLTLSSDTLVKVAGSGGLSVTGPLNVTGTISQTGAVIGTSATYSGQVQAATVSSTGVINGASATVTGQVQAATVTSSGAIQATGTITSSNKFVHSTGAVNSSDFLGQSPGLTTDHYVYTRAIVNEAQVGASPAAIVFGNGATYGTDEISLITDGATRMYFQTGGNVGVGTNNPKQKLEVHGNMLLGQNDVNSFVHSGNQIAVTADASVLIVADSNDVSGSGASDIIFGYGSAIDTNVNRDFTFDEAFPAGLPRVETMRIDSSNGRVGIGTSSPGKTLDVNGTVRGTTISATVDVITQTVTCSVLIHPSDTNTNIQLQGSDQILLRAGGNDILSISDTDVRLGEAGTANQALFFSGSVEDFSFANRNSGSTAQWRLRRGDLNNTLLFWVNAGDLSISGQLTQNSDYRNKKEIRPIDDDYAMSVIRALEPKTFKWKEEGKNENVNNYGFMAQEVETHFPDMVSSDEGVVVADQAFYPAQITSDTTMEITVSDGSTWTSGDKVIIKDGKQTPQIQTITIDSIQGNVLSLSSETISSDFINEESKTYIYGQEVDDLRGLRSGFLDPLMISALQQLDRRVAALENR